MTQLTHEQIVALPEKKNPGILLAVPCYGSQLTQPFVQCLLNLLSQTQVIGLIDFLPGDSLVNRARNNLVHNFLHGYPDGQGNRVLYDWLLFLDADLVFQAESVQMLYDLATSRGPGVYCGTYPIKQLKPKVVFNNMPGCKPGPDGVVEVREAGTGFMLIHRDVFAQMIEKFGDEIRFETDMGDTKAPRTIKYDFFTVGVRKDPILGYKRFLSEDWYFCQRWREIGGKILMQTKIQCGHIGNFMFPGNAQEILGAADHIRQGMEVLSRAASAQQPLVVKVGGAEPVKVGPPEHFEPVAKSA